MHFLVVLLNSPALCLIRVLFSQLPNKSNMVIFSIFSHLHCFFISTQNVINIEAYATFPKVKVILKKTKTWMSLSHIKRKRCRVINNHIEMAWKKIFQLSFTHHTNFWRCTHLISRTLYCQHIIPMKNILFHFVNGSQYYDGCF